MRKTLMTLALGCLALTAGAQATQQRANLVVDNRHEVVGEQHFQDIVFDLEANETIDGITLNARSNPTYLYTRTLYCASTHHRPTGQAGPDGLGGIPNQHASRPQRLRHTLDCLQL